MIDKEAIWYIIAFILCVIFILRIYLIQKTPDTLYVNGIAINALRDEELIKLYNKDDIDPIIREAIKSEILRRHI
jgi:hypothetical protein